MMHEVKRCEAACITVDIRHVVCNAPISRSFTCCKGCLVLCRIYAGSAHMWSGWWWSRKCGNHSTHPQSCRQSYIIFKKHGRRWADMCKHAFGCLAIDDSMQHARSSSCMLPRHRVSCGFNESRAFDSHGIHDRRSNF